MAGKKLFGRMWITRTIYTQRVSIFLYASVHTLRFQSAFFCGDLGWFHCSVEQQEFLSLRSSSSPSTAIDSKHTHTKKRDSSTSLVSFTFVEKRNDEWSALASACPFHPEKQPPSFFFQLTLKDGNNIQKKKKGANKEVGSFHDELYSHKAHRYAERPPSLGSPSLSFESTINTECLEIKK